MDKTISPSIFAAMRTPLIAAGLTLFSLAQMQAEEEGGKLKKARDQVRPPSSSASSSSSGSGSSSSGPSHSSHSSQSSLHESGGWSLFDIFFSSDDSTPSSYSSPSYHTHSSNSSPSHGLLDYPYADGELGWLVSEKSSPVPKESLPPGVAPASNRENLSLFGGAVRGEYTDCGDGLKRYAEAIQVSFTYLRLETEWQRYIEHLPNGSTDSLTLGTLGVAIAFPVKDHITLTIGAGASFYHDPSGDETGWYGKAGLEIYPIRPLILNAEVWGGYVRADEFDAETFIGGGRATAGVIWNRFELYGGWQATWIEAVTLSGPTIGLRVWF